MQIGECHRCSFVDRGHVPIVSGRDLSSAPRQTAGAPGSSAIPQHHHGRTGETGGVLFGVLGTLEVHDDPGRSRWKGPMANVLAMLVLDANSVVPLERIIDDLWGGTGARESHRDRARGVSILRRTLEPDRSPRAAATVLVSQAPGYLLRVEPDDIDAARFERLRSQEVRRCTPSMRFRPSRSSTTRSCSAGAGARRLCQRGWAASHDAARGDPPHCDRRPIRRAAGAGHEADVVADLEAAVAVSPLRERLWGQLIVALYRCGRQADALRTYQRARNVLAEELGIEPAPELQALERQVLEQS